MLVGIDVAKAELVISVLPSAERFTVDNDEQGVRTLVQRVASSRPQLIVLEATGGYALLAVAALAAAELPVVVVNLRQVRDFAKATGQLAKTDRIDAAAHERDALLTRRWQLTPQRSAAAPPTKSGRAGDVRQHGDRLPHTDSAASGNGSCDISDVHTRGGRSPARVLAPYPTEAGHHDDLRSVALGLRWLPRFSTP